MTIQAESQAETLPAEIGVGPAESRLCEGGIHMALDRPAQAPETADGTTAPAVAAPLASGFAAYGGLAQMFTPPPPDFWPRQTRG